MYFFFMGRLDCGLALAGNLNESKSPFFLILFSKLRFCAYDKVVEGSLRCGGVKKGREYEVQST